MGNVTEPSGAQRARPYAAWRDGSILHVTGDIDQTNWLEVAESVAGELRAGAVELDLSQVGFFGAAGVRALLHTRAAWPPAGPLRVTCSRMVYRVLSICGSGIPDGVVLTQAAAHRDPQPRAGA